MTITRIKIATAVGILVCLSVGSANAQTLTANFEPNKPLEIMNTNEDPDNKADISVFAGTAGYQGIGGNPNSNTTGEPAPVSGMFGDGTVVDYRFFQSPADETISLELLTYAQGTAGRIGTVFATDAANVAGNQSFIQLWETTDPVGFTTTADYTTATMAGLADGNGSIDISNMIDGDIYFLAGGFGGTERFTLTMTGPGQPDIEVIGDGSWPRPNRVHLHDWSFTNPGLLYDTIDYHFFHADRDGSAARFAGVILDGTIDEGGDPLQGDLDGDDMVGQSDLDLVLLNWGSAAAWPGEPQPGATVGQVELDAVLLNWGSSQLGGVSSANVPEPSTLVLIGLAGIAGVGYLRK